MLAADAAAGEFFKTHHAPSSTVLAADASLSPSIEKAGDRLDRYKLLRLSPTSPTSPSSARSWPKDNELAPLRKHEDLKKGSRSWRRR
jgi:hypothetical protein